MREDSSENIDHYIIKYLDNDIGISEKEILDSWVSASEENEHYFLRMAKTWEQSMISLQKESSTESYFIRFQKRLYRKKNRRTMYRISASAAAVLLFLSIQLYVVPSFKNSHITEITADRKREITLPDGSVVWLNKYSKLEYPKKFERNRNVLLTGEAFFNVTHNMKHPFTVEASETVIRVMGTSFTVTNYIENGLTEAVIKTGCVQFITPQTDKEIFLHQGQKVSYEKVSGKIEVKTVNTTNIARWINNHLTFENVHLSDVFTQLEKWYGISIKCTDSLILNTPVTFTIDTESKEEILDTLRDIVPFTWKEQKNSKKKLTTIIISPMTNNNS